MSKINNVPQIRFKGFTDAWEQRKLGSFADVTKLAGFEFTEHVVYSDTGEIIALRGLNVKEGQLVLNDVKYIDGSNFDKLNRSKLFKNDILFTYVGTVGDVAIIKENDRFYLAPNVARIRIQSKDSPIFVSHFMRNNNFYRKVILPLIATSSQPALSMENIRKFELYIPSSREEQDKSAELFENIDKEITLHQRKYDQVVNFKKAMLEKMFPKSGSDTPEIRFKGYTGGWEQRKLKEIGEIQTGNTPPTADPKNYSEDGMLWVTPTDIEELVITKTAKRISELGKKKARIASKGSVLVTCIASIGKNTLLYEDAAFNQQINSITPNGEYDSYFLLTQSFKISEKMANSAAAATMQIVNKSQFSNLDTILPIYTEQAEIGRLFLYLDNLITLHQRKLQQLKKIKKAMLEKMFV